MEAAQTGGQQLNRSGVRPHRRLPVGADVLPDGGVHFRVWASQRRHVEVVLDGGTGFYADPLSRFQPNGPHGPSQVIDPYAFQWRDAHWRGVPLEGQVLYEMHLGTFTPEGTWEAARRELAALAELGITVLEIMPVNDFPGQFGWGYDGVNLFAPTRLYGTPDDCRRFIDQAHALGIGVILDVVYNHIGPEGNVLSHFSPEYFTDRYSTDWGEAINAVALRPAASEEPEEP